MNSLNLDGSALSLMYMRTTSVCVILPALCRVTASELRDAGRQKPVTCLEPVLSVSLWPRPVFPRSGQVASAGIIPACASLSLSAVARKSPGYGLGLFYLTATGVGSPAAQSVLPVRVCMFRDENRVLDNVL